MQHCNTQWRVGFGGPYALDYNAVFLVAGALGLSVDAHMLRGLKALEYEELARMSKEADTNKDQ